MVEILEKSKCTGCGACISICNHNAISPQYDYEGFEYPIVNQKACVDCGLCQLTCPVINYKYDKRKEYSNAQIGYAARNKDYDQRLISSSGSIFPVLAEYILERKGLVVGVAYDDIFNAEHLIIDNKNDLYKLQGSKYLQCKIDNSTFGRIKDELKQGRLVLYSAMACQIEGLKAFLRKEYDNLYTIDLICMGIPSAKVWQIYLNTFFKNEIIKSINFKEKSLGWDSFCFCVETNKRTFKERGIKNLYLQSMFRSWNMRPSCFNCKFKKSERISDFTIADCWGASKLVPQINDNKGLSSVIVHSYKGMALWHKIESRLDFIEIPIDEIAKGNSNLVSNKSQSGNRNEFYKLLTNNPQKAFTKLCSVNPTLGSKILTKLKKVLKIIIR